MKWNVCFASFAFSTIKRYSSLCSAAIDAVIHYRQTHIDQPSFQSNRLFITTAELIPFSDCVLLLFYHWLLFGLCTRFASFVVLVIFIELRPFVGVHHSLLAIPSVFRRLSNVFNRLARYFVHQFFDSGAIEIHCLISIFNYHRLISCC